MRTASSTPGTPRDTSSAKALTASKHQFAACSHINTNTKTTPSYGPHA
jgi:hypothetical protein